MDEKKTEDALELNDENLVDAAGGRRVALNAALNRRLESTEPADEGDDDQVALCPKCGMPRFLCICGQY